MNTHQSSKLITSFGFATPITIILSIIATPAQSASLTLGSLSFTEMTSDVKLIGGIAGTGTSDNPIVLFQEITGKNAAIKVQDALSLNAPEYKSGFFLKTIVINKTGENWIAFKHEFQSIFNIPSSGEDSLSFAEKGICPAVIPYDCWWNSQKTTWQGRDIQPPFSDKFATAQPNYSGQDSILFTNALANSISPNETVSFQYPITRGWSDSLNTFYLRQTYQSNAKPVPIPSSFLGVVACGIIIFGRSLKSKSNIV